MSLDPRYTLFAARAVFDDRLSAMDVRVLAALGTFTDRQGWCHPSQTTIANRLGTSRTRVNSSLKSLVEAGYVQTVKQALDNGAQTVSLYRVLMDLSAPEAAADVLASGEIVELLPVSNTDTPLSAGGTGLGSVAPDPERPLDIAPLSAGDTPPCTAGDTPPCQPVVHRTNPNKEHSQSRHRATRLSATWAPRNDEIVFGVAGGLSEPEVFAAAEHMRDWAHANSKGKVNWDLTFRNWLRTAISDAKRGRRPVVTAATASPAELERRRKLYAYDGTWRADWGPPPTQTNGSIQ